VGRLVKTKLDYKVRQQVAAFHIRHISAVASVVLIGHKQGHFETHSSSFEQ
jgi:hypothetical protein